MTYAHSVSLSSIEIEITHCSEEKQTHIQCILLLRIDHHLKVASCCVSYSILFFLRSTCDRNSFIWMCDEYVCRNRECSTYLKSDEIINIYEILIFFCHYIDILYVVWIFFFYSFVLFNSMKNTSFFLFLFRF